MSPDFGTSRTRCFLFFYVQIIAHMQIETDNCSKLFHCEQTHQPITTAGRHIYHPTTTTDSTTMLWFKSPSGSLLHRLLRWDASICEKCLELSRGHPKIHPEPPTVRFQLPLSTPRLRKEEGSPNHHLSFPWKARWASSLQICVVWWSPCAQCPQTFGSTGSLIKGTVCDWCLSLMLKAVVSRFSCENICFVEPNKHIILRIIWCIITVHLLNSSCM